MRATVIIPVFFLGLLCFSQSLLAQTEDSSLVINRIPAISLTNPNPYLKGYIGALGFGGTLQQHSRLGVGFDPDLNIVAMIGAGNPEKYVGIDLGFNIFGFPKYGGREDNGGEGSMDLHLNRMITPNWWIGAGMYNLFIWSSDEPTNLRSGYLASSAVLHLRENNRSAFSTLWLTVGAGNGKFRTDNTYTLENASPPGIFGSLALQVLPEMNFLAEWTGYNVFSGFSMIPFRKLPFQIIAGVDDIFHERRHWVVGGSFGLRIFKNRYDTPFRPVNPLGEAPSPQPSRL